MTSIVCTPSPQSPPSTASHPPLRGRCDHSPPAIPAHTAIIHLHVPQLLKISQPPSPPTSPPHPSTHPYHAYPDLPPCSPVAQPEEQRSPDSPYLPQRLPNRAVTVPLDCPPCSPVAQPEEQRSPGSPSLPQRLPNRAVTVPLDCPPCSPIAQPEEQRSPWIALPTATVAQPCGYSPPGLPTLLTGGPTVGAPVPPGRPNPH